MKEEPLEQRLDALSAEVDKTEATKDLGLFDEAISTTLQELPENPYTDYFTLADDRFQGTIRGLGDVRKEVLQFTRIGRFYSMLGLNWLVTE